MMGKGGKDGKDGDKPPTCFLGNIGDLTKEELQAAFQQNGCRPVSVRVVMDRDSGQSRGFGFAEFAQVEDARHAARTMSGVEVSGRSMRVDVQGEEKGKGKGG